MDFPGTFSVLISGNTVIGYQKNGITANGGVSATITGNIVGGAGRVTYIAQNGIQVGFGGTGTVTGNSISGNYFNVPKSYVACGLLYPDAGSVRSSQNMFRDDQFNVCNFGGRGGGHPSA